MARSKLQKKPLDIGPPTNFVHVQTVPYGPASLMSATRNTANSLRATHLTPNFIPLRREAITVPETVCDDEQHCVACPRPTEVRSLSKIKGKQQLQYQKHILDPLSSHPVSVESSAPAEPSSCSDGEPSKLLQLSSRFDSIGNGSHRSLSQGVSPIERYSKSQPIAKMVHKIHRKQASQDLSSNNITSAKIHPHDATISSQKVKTIGHLNSHPISIRPNETKNDWLHCWELISSYVSASSKGNIDDSDRLIDQLQQELPPGIRCDRDILHNLFAIEDIPKLLQLVVDRGLDSEPDHFGYETHNGRYITRLPVGYVLMALKTATERLARYGIPEVGSNGCRYHLHKNSDDCYLVKGAGSKVQEPHANEEERWIKKRDAMVIGIRKTRKSESNIPCSMSFLDDGSENPTFEDTNKKNIFEVPSAAGDSEIAMNRVKSRSNLVEREMYDIGAIHHAYSPHSLSAMSEQSRRAPWDSGNHMTATKSIRRVFGISVKIPQTDGQTTPIPCSEDARPSSELPGKYPESILSAQSAEKNSVSNHQECHWK